MSEFTYSKISVTGQDAFDFLQAQLATDLVELLRASDAGAHRSTWCNPKGRVICTPAVTKTDSGFELVVPADLSDTVLPRLTMFRFRAKVDIDLVEGPDSTADAELQKLQAGIPRIALAQSEKFTPHMLNLDLLGMVSLDKGCYPGQEIVARTHYRGASKRRCLRFGNRSSAQPGDKVSDGERNVGEVVNAIDNELLAIVPLTAADQPLFAGEDSLARLPLPYAF